MPLFSLPWHDMDLHDRLQSLFSILAPTLDVNAHMPNPPNPKFSTLRTDIIYPTQPESTRLRDRLQQLLRKHWSLEPEYGSRPAVIGNVV